MSDGYVCLESDTSFKFSVHMCCTCDVCAFFLGPTEGMLNRETGRKPEEGLKNRFAPQDGEGNIVT